MNWNADAEIKRLHQEAWERQFENRWNEFFRNCRIGRVISKTARGGLLDILKHVRPPSVPGYPNYDSGWVPGSMPNCGCRVGSSCGNVACPHRLVAT